jgi:hypothetical protein
VYVSLYESAVLLSSVLLLLLLLLPLVSPLLLLFLLLLLRPVAAVVRYHCSCNCCYCYRRHCYHNYSGSTSCSSATAVGTTAPLVASVTPAVTFSTALNNHCKQALVQGDLGTRTCSTLSITEPSSGSIPPELPTVVKYFMTCLVLSVLPAPLSPLISID